MTFRSDGFGCPAFGWTMTGRPVVKLLLFDGVARPLHIHARAAVERHDAVPCSTMNAAACSGSMPIMVRNVEPSSVTS